MSDLPFSSQHYLDIVYHNIPVTKSLLKEREGSITATYGEILSSGITKLLSYLSLNTTDVFYDLGSGAGKIVLQVFIDCDVKAAYGIELSKYLHQLSVTADLKVQHDLPHLYDNRQLVLVNGNFLQYPLQGATVILINSICYSQSILLLFAKLINKIDSIHTLISLRPVPGLKRLKFKKTIKVQCSWDSSICYIYR